MGFNKRLLRPALTTQYVRSVVMSLPAQEALMFLLHLALLCFQTGKLRVVAHDCNLSYLEDKEVEAILEAIETLSQST